MDLALRRDIYERLEDSAVAYGLTDLTFPSFRRHFGYKCIMAASDVVYSLTALMEASADVARSLGVELNLSGYTMDERGAYDDDVCGARNGFYLALDALEKYVESISD